MRSSSSGHSGRRPLRIASEIQRDLPDIIRRLNVLPDNLIVSITDVEVTPDLSHAKVFFSILGTEEEQSGKRAEKLLNEKKGAIRTEIAHRMVMRQHPEIRFEYDRTPARAARIEALLKQVGKNKDSESGAE